MRYGNNISEKELLNKLKKYNLLQVFSDLPDGINANAGLNGGNLLGMQKVKFWGLLKNRKDNCIR